MCITPCFCDTANQDREQAAVEAKACRAEEAIVLAEMFGYRFHIKSHAVADFSPSSHRDICNAQASEALAAAGLPAAVRKALDFEHELAKLTHGQGPRATAAQLMSHAVCVCVCVSVCKMQIQVAMERARRVQNFNGPRDLPQSESLRIKMEMDGVGGSLSDPQKRSLRYSYPQKRSLKYPETHDIQVIGLPLPAIP